MPEPANTILSPTLRTLQHPIFELSPISLMMNRVPLGLSQPLLEEILQGYEPMFMQLEAVRAEEFPDFADQARHFRNAASATLHRGDALYFLPGTPMPTEQEILIYRAALEQFLMMQTSWTFDLAEAIGRGDLTPDVMSRLPVEFRESGIYGAVSLLLYFGAPKERELLRGFSWQALGESWRPEDAALLGDALANCCQQAVWGLPMSKIEVAPSDFVTVLEIWWAGECLRRGRATQQQGLLSPEATQDVVESVEDKVHCALLALKERWHGENLVELAQSLREEAKPKQSPAAVLETLANVHELDLPQRLFHATRTLLGDRGALFSAHLDRYEWWTAGETSSVLRYLLEAIALKRLPAGKEQLLAEVGPSTTTLFLEELRKVWAKHTPVEQRRMRITLEATLPLFRYAQAWQKNTPFQG